MTLVIIDLLIYSGLSACVFLIKSSPHIVACIAILVCALQQIKLDITKHAAESKVKVYETFIQKQLRRYKEEIFNAKNKHSETNVNTTSRIRIPRV